MPRREVRSLMLNGNSAKHRHHHEHRSKKGRRQPKQGYSHIQIWRVKKEELKLKDSNEQD